VATAVLEELAQLPEHILPEAAVVAIITMEAAPTIL
jgi:hypothetical protein